MQRCLPGLCSDLQANTLTKYYLTNTNVELQYERLHYLLPLQYVWGSLYFCSAIVS